MPWGETNNIAKILAVLPGPLPIGPGFTFGNQGSELPPALSDFFPSSWSSISWLRAVSSSAKRMVTWRVREGVKGCHAFQNGKTGTSGYSESTLLLDMAS